MISRERLRLVAVVVATLWSLACWTDPRVVWSPDGRQAAVVATDGLHFSDEKGTLSPMLVPGVARAVWFADSERLVLVKRKELRGFAPLAAMLGPEQTQDLVDMAEVVWQQMQAPAGPMDASDRIFAMTGLGLGLPFSDTEDVETAIGWYLLEHHGAAIREKLGTNASLDDLSSITVNSLVVARLVDGRLEVGAPLYSGLDHFVDIRPAPDGAAVAFVTQVEAGIERDFLTAHIVSTDGSEPATVVATPTGGYLDWSSDGRSLWYFDVWNDDDRNPEIYIGALTEHEVLDRSGRIKVAPSGSWRVSVMFSKESRVRSIADGRVMFDASEMRFPAVLSDEALTDRDQLFIFDRTRATLTSVIPNDHLARLPVSLAAFEPSPDSAHVLIGGGLGDLWIMCIPDGTLEHIETGFEHSDHVDMPSWRSSGEFVYLKKVGSRREVVLRRGDSERVLSAAWPSQIFPSSE